jgi:UDP-MurNAc hydroxylase
MPGDRCHPRSQVVLTNPRWEGFSYDRLGPYLEGYALERALELSRLYIPPPEPEESLAERFAAHFTRLAGLSRYFLERISMTVRFEVEGTGGDRWDVHLEPDRAWVDLNGGADAVQYRFTLDARWLAPVLEGTATWDDLLFSLRFSVSRDPDVPNDHLIWLLRHADRDALLSIEAYERSHDLVERRGRPSDGLEHYEEEGEDELVDDPLGAPLPRGRQVLPPSMR